MAPSDLLRHIFRHGPYAKLKTDAQSASEVKSQHRSKNASATGHSRLTRTSRSTLRDNASGVLETINEEKTPSTTSIAEVLAQMKESDPPGTLAPASSPTTTSSPEENFAQLLYQAEIMTSSHLDTIETALALLEAMEHLSPHVVALKQEMLEKKSWCEGKMEKLGIIEELETGGRVEEEWPLRR